MKKNKLLKTSLTLLGALSLVCESGLAIIDSNGQLFKTAEDRPIESIIVKFNKNSSVKNLSMQEISSYIGKKTSLDLKPDKKLSSGAYVFKVTYHHYKALSKSAAKQQNKMLASQLMDLQSDPAVKYANLNDYMYMQKIPNDSRYTEQWHYFDNIGGMNLPSAWEITTGSKQITVGVVDTGIVEHEDLEGKVLPGYNFVDDEYEEDNPTDHGGETSYHGTHVAGTIGAVTDKYGVVAGVSWGSKIVPARVLGDDGSGSMANILEGMRWVAGISHIKNPNPAKIINLSLGGFGKCDESLQETIDEINNAGSIVVVAAGNSSMNAKYFKPANCKNVITVGASTKDGKKAFYSNYGAQTLDIIAPGGDTRDIAQDGILSLGAPGMFQFLQGTSMAAPHISGLLALMLSLEPDLSVDNAVKYMQKSVKNKVMDVGLVDASKVLAMLKDGVNPDDIEDEDTDSDSELEDLDDLDDVF